MISRGLVLLAKPLAGLLPGYQHQIGSLTTKVRIHLAIDLLDQITGPGAVRADLSRRRLERILAIDTEAGELRKTIAGLVAPARTSIPARVRSTSHHSPPAVAMPAASTAMR